jgi:hypothetical protein
MNDISASTRTPAAMVDEYLRLLMISDPSSGRRIVAPDLCVRFSGGRAMRGPGEDSAEWLLVRAGLAVL